MMTTRVITNYTTRGDCNECGDWDIEKVEDCSRRRTAAALVCISEELGDGIDKRQDLGVVK